MGDFTIVSTNTTTDAKTCDIGSATLIEKGDLVAVASGLIIKAVAASTAIGIACEASISGDTKIVVMSEMGLLLEGTGDANFAVTMKGAEVDLVGTTTQLIDVGASTTKVLKVDYSTEAGVAGATTNIQVRINKPL